MAAKKLVKAETAPNDPRDYIVLKKFRILGKYVYEGDEITLKPSQAQYYLITKRLEEKAGK